MIEFKYILDESRKIPILKNSEMDLEYIVIGYSQTFIKTINTDIYKDQVSNYKSLIEALHNDFPELLI